MLLKALLPPAGTMAGGYGVLHASVVAEDYLLLAGAMLLLVLGAVWMLRPLRDHGRPTHA